MRIMRLLDLIKIYSGKYHTVDCKYCGKTFVGRTEWKKHEAKHNGIRES